MAKLSQFSFAFLCVCLYLFLSGSGVYVYAATFTVVNECSYTIWPGILSGASSQVISPSGFVLEPGQANSITIPAGWSGRIWGRTLCTQDSTGKFSCVTGDCGSSASPTQCVGGAIPPATLAEFTLNGAGGLDFYDVSLVDGYNLPMSIAPQGGTAGNCSATACAADVNVQCPADLRMADGGSSLVGCRSACDVFQAPQYCCIQEYASPEMCKPSSYSQYFKTLCPQAYSYAFDDATSTFTCSSFNYLITFCPTPPTSQRAVGGSAADPLAFNGATNLSSRCTWFLFPTAFIAVAEAIWRFLRL